MVDAIQQFREGIRDDLRWDGEWRCEKADEYPEDNRNEAAATMLFKLSREVDELDNEIILELLKIANMHEDFVEVWGENRRSMGFGYMPKTAVELLTDVMDGCCSRLDPSVLRRQMSLVRSGGGGGDRENSDN